MSKLFINKPFTNAYLYKYLLSTFHLGAAIVVLCLTTAPSGVGDEFAFEVKIPDRKSVV